MSMVAFKKHGSRPAHLPRFKYAFIKEDRCVAHRDYVAYFRSEKTKSHRTGRCGFWTHLSCGMCVTHCRMHHDGRHRR